MQRDQSRLLIAVTCCWYVALLLVILLPSDSGATDFLNISLPGCETASPRILRSTPSETVFARRNMGSVQVLRVSRNGESFVGRNGDAVTPYWPRLLDAGISQEGEMWVIAERFAPSESPDLAQIAYCLQDNEWEEVGKHVTSGLLVSEEGRMGFLGRDPLWYMKAGITSLDVNGRLFNVVSPAWTPFPVLWGGGEWRIAWSREAAVVVRINDRGEVESFPLRRDGKGVGGRVVAELGLGHWRVNAASLSGRGCLALLVSADQRGQRILLNVVENGALREVRLGQQPGAVAGIEWSPNGKLHVVTVREPVPTGMSLMRLAEGEWEQLACIDRTPSDPYILDPQLSFRTDGLPLVVWENFVPAPGVLPLHDP